MKNALWGLLLLPAASFAVIGAQSSRTVIKEALVEVNAVYFSRGISRSVAGIIENNGVLQLEFSRNASLIETSISVKFAGANYGSIVVVKVDDRIEHNAVYSCGNGECRIDVGRANDLEVTIDEKAVYRVRIR